MFSQFRQAVENLAQPIPRQSQDSDDPFRQSSPSPHLPENALRKSIAAQRTATSPHNAAGQRSRSASPSSTAKGSVDAGLRKTTLEERLRASFAVSESSASVSSMSTAPPAHMVQTTHHPLSPTSTPLPDSPLVMATLDGLAPVEETNGTNGILPPSQEPDLNDPPRLPSVAPPPTGPEGSTEHPIDGAPLTTDPGMDVPLVQDTPQETEIVSEQSCVRVSELPTENPDRPREESAGAEPEPAMPVQRQDASVEALQERLKLVEQRFADVSTSFKKLQAERRDMDSVITELTPLSGSEDVEALREYLVNANMKIELGQDELQRLNGKLTRQEERLEELRDTHGLETTSQSDQIERLRRQLNEAEALVTASHSTALQTEEANAKRDSDTERLRAEVVKANETAKEEEEKRVKAISLLKTVRQKLVKAEKERDDTARELSEAREKYMEEKEKDRAERANLERKVDAANAEREKTVMGLRAQFDKDISATKDRSEKDIQNTKKQLEAEMNALKTSYSTDVSAKKSRINILEITVATLTNENKSFFEQMELRQAELESSQCHAESLQAQNTELQFQLKELQERISLLGDEIGELRGEHEFHSQVSGASTEEISQLVSSIETRYEAKLSDLKRTLITAEKERTEAEANWSRKLTEKTVETEELKRMLQSTAQLRERDEDISDSLRAEIEKLQTEARSQHTQLYELQTRIDTFKDAESTLHQRLSEGIARADDSEKQLDESKSREAQLRTQNKTLRDELRKIQNSIAILEKQRNPGAGYWTSRPEATNSRLSINLVADASHPSSPPPVRNEEEINYEYLRNVVLQFLEHKEMRPNLVRVLSTILRFTPQETRRLMSKV